MTNMTCVTYNFHDPQSAIRNPKLEIRQGLLSGANCENISHCKTPKTFFYPPECC